MPVEDECQFETAAAIEAWEDAKEMCHEAEDAAEKINEARDEAYDDCSYLANLGGGFNSLLEDLDEETKNSILDELMEDVEECMSEHWAVLDAWNDFENLMAACEVFFEEAEAIQKELDGCLHELHDGIPFA